MARRVIESIVKDHSDLEMNIVDVIASPVQSFKDGIRMIPAIKCDDRILSGIFLSRSSISSFIKKIRTTS